MTVQPREGSGSLPEQTISNCEASHGERQVSVPPDTEPSAFTVAPFETSQIRPLGSATHSDPEGPPDATVTPAG